VSQLKGPCRSEVQELLPLCSQGQALTLSAVVWENCLMNFTQR
jgi:hypothetical protein